MNREASAPLVSIGDDHVQQGALRDMFRAAAPPSTVQEQKWTARSVKVEAENGRLCEALGWLVEASAHARRFLWNVCADEMFPPGLRRQLLRDATPLDQAREAAHEDDRPQRQLQAGS